MKLDSKDKTIVSMYAKNPDVAQDEVATAVNLSQPSVAVRIRKLKEAGALEKQVGINPLKMGLYIAKVDVSSNDTAKMLDMFRNCPYFANGFTVSGKHNLCLFFISENIATLEAIVNGHIRSDPAVKEVDFNIIINSERNLVIPTVISHEQKTTPPCGICLECRDCGSFKQKRCMGCPVIGQYQGDFF